MAFLCSEIVPAHAWFCVPQKAQVQYVLTGLVLHGQNQLCVRTNQPFLSKTCYLSVLIGSSLKMNYERRSRSCRQGIDFIYFPI